jgi:hypothetical protein
MIAYGSVEKHSNNCYNLVRQSICATECKIIPNRFNENLNRLFTEMFRENISAVISDMVFELQKVAKI